MLCVASNPREPGTGYGIITPPYVNPRSDAYTTASQKRLCARSGKAVGAVKAVRSARLWELDGRMTVSSLTVHCSV
jgi:hypothetical protein